MTTHVGVHNNKQHGFLQMPIDGAVGWRDACWFNVHTMLVCGSIDLADWLWDLGCNLREKWGLSGSKKQVTTICGQCGLKVEWVSVYPLVSLMLA